MREKRTGERGAAMLVLEVCHSSSLMFSPSYSSMFFSRERWNANTRYYTLLHFLFAILSQPSPSRWPRSPWWISCPWWSWAWSGNVDLILIVVLSLCLCWLAVSTCFLVLTGDFHQVYVNVFSRSHSFCIPRLTAVSFSDCSNKSISTSYSHAL